MKALRWRFAAALNLSKRFCWAELVMWAMRWGGFRQVLDSGTSVCREDAARTGVCWCSKLRTEAVQREAEAGCGVMPAPRRFVVRGES